MVPNAQYDESALFLKIAEGDETAFTVLFHAYTPKLLPFIFKLTRNEYLAKEMIQETFLQLWLHRLDLTKVNEPASWLFRIAANISITWLRKQSNRERILEMAKDQLTTTLHTTTETLEGKELTLIISRAVEQLPPKRREIYSLSREQGLNHREIAQKLNLSSITVANQIGISLKFIREFINKETGLSAITLFLLFRR